jgi:D-serine deaminase-like pyridoxal phosphate-dependent protein
VTPDLQTPAALVDRARLERNTARMSERAARAGIALRPHVKTAKSAEVARLATRGHDGGITVSTLAEADYFLDRGFADMTYAVCIAPGKLDRVDALADRGARLQLITDDAGVARELARRAPGLRHRLAVVVEIDSGEHRTGVDASSDELLEIAGILDRADGVDLRGVLTHGGHSYGCRSVDEVVRVADEERLAVVRAAGRLRAAGLPCPVVSAGSTPTAVHAASFEGLTEIRPGVYVFFDLAQLGRGSCTADEIALTVLATVISHRPDHNRLIVDAGGLALSKDTSANAFVPDAGYGWVVDPVTQERIGDLRVAAADQEHGFVEGTEIPYARLPIGSRVRIVPNHACMTAAAYDRYYVVDENAGVVAEWDRAGGW